jgi:hypothetical protein
LRQKPVKRRNGKENLAIGRFGIGRFIAKGENTVHTIAVSVHTGENTVHKAAVSVHTGENTVHTSEVRRTTMGKRFLQKKIKTFR